MKRLRRATRTIWFDEGGADALGRNGVRFTYPRIDAPQFVSLLVNDRNYELSGVSRWQDLIDRVTTRRKPTAFVNSAVVRLYEKHGGERSGVDDPMREAARRAIDAGCCMRLHRTHARLEPEPRVSCALSISGRVADVFDLDALLADYRRYTHAAGSRVAASIADELDAISGCDVSEFLDFERLIGPDEANSSPGDWARRGLLLGYPVDTTVAIICAETGVRGCGTHDVGWIASEYRRELDELRRRAPRPRCAPRFGRPRKRGPTR